jgi:hypothetical protein
MSTLNSWTRAKRTITRIWADRRLEKLLIIGGLEFAIAAGAATLPPLCGDLQIHDPSTIVNCGDHYWVFGTGQGISSRVSQDLVN